MILHSEFILYVKNQEESKNFYEQLLDRKADLHVPGMTEFILSDSCKLGLMPNSGISKILNGKTPHPDLGNGIPRCELYFIIENLNDTYYRALKMGAKLISPIEERNWGDKACYFADPDGHVIAFAEKIKL